VHVFRRDPVEGWLTALFPHPRLECWLPAGGHVEAGETPAETAVREVMEEAGLRVRLLSGPAVPPPPGFPHQPVTAPWWVSEMPASFSELGHFSAGHASRQARMQPPVSSAAVA